VLALRLAQGDQPYVLTEPSTTLGRSSECIVVIPLPTVSRVHAVIEAQHDRYLIRDLESANGTFVNGARIEAPRQLTSGDEIWIGTRQATLSFFDPEETLLVPGAAAMPLLIDERARVVYVYGVQVQLSPLEHRLLHRLAAEPGAVVTREALFRDVWGQPYDPVTCEDALNAAVAKLRRNLRASAAEVGAAPPVLTTVPRTGFRLDTRAAFGPDTGPPEQERQIEH
jgi:pSer/pThr/pTyr-binding forkhead associated (FHA) protein